MIEVRRADADDAAAIAHVIVESWRSGYRGIVPDEVLAKLSVEERARLWRGILSERKGAAFVASRDSEVVGTAHAGPGSDAGTFELFCIYVLEEEWGNGVGARLLQSVIGEARKSAAVKITAWVLLDNARARRFYERMGFEIDSEPAPSRWPGIQQIRYGISLRNAQ
jgi:ribosomal protein S18 acetylase RimI-like enzyme